MAAIMRRGRPAQIAGLLVGLGMKGERPTELVGFAQTMRANAVPIRRRPAPCSTPAARVAIDPAPSIFPLPQRSFWRRAGCAWPSTATDRSRVNAAADVLEALGVNIQAGADTAAACLNEVGLAFLFAPTFHPAMKHAAQARRPRGARRRSTCSDRSRTRRARRGRSSGAAARIDRTAGTVALAARVRARRVVHGADGLDELSTTGYTKVSECRGLAVQTFYVHPADFGLVKATPRR